MPLAAASPAPKHTTHHTPFQTHESRLTQKQFAALVNYAIIGAVGAVGALIGTIILLTLTGASGRH